MDHFSDLRQLARDIRDKLEEKKIILLYAYNGVGKTRLSMEFKDLGKIGGERDTLYFNAFTEDLFSWDNDLDEDATRVLKMNLKSSFFSGAKEYALEDKIRVFWGRFSDIVFQIDYEDGSISFSRVFNLREGEDPNQETVIDNIKISRGEETIFVWCFFLAIVQLVLDGDEGYSWVKYIYIDDPISSLDDNNAIAVAVLLAETLKEGSKKVVISTHHALFYNALWNVFKDSVGKRKWLGSLHFKKNGEEGYSVSYTNDTPRFLHVAMLEELWHRAESGDLYTYHFAMLRNVLERAASFHGYEKFDECFKNKDIQEESPLYSRIINIFSHGKYSLYEPTEMMEDNKELFKQILSAFITNYKFNPDLFLPREA
ncbi:AAA family ATPase [Porphyromonadaceae bacterium W3.11]|nr:AAA family ATPase [Porphyromonadaceae bacterium W3.11]